MCTAAEAQQGSLPSENSQRPNFLLLLADDLGVDQLEAYSVGTDLPKTPDIDAMAAQGVLFRRAWTNPVGAYRGAAIGKWYLSNDNVDPLTGLPADPNCDGFLHPNLSGYDHYSGPN